MKPSLPLKAAAILSFLVAAGHTIGGLSLWSPAGENDALRTMRTFHFDAMGASRTYLDFYLGFGFTISAFLFMQAALLWQLAAAANAGSLGIRPMVVSFTLASAAATILAWHYIFIVPALLSAAITACLAASFYVAD